MSRHDLEDRLPHLLEREAERATVSPDAWARIQRRLGPSRSAAVAWYRSPGRLAAVGAAAAAAVLGAVAVPQLVAGDGTTVEVAPTLGTAGEDGSETGADGDAGGADADADADTDAGDEGAGDAETDADADGAAAADGWEAVPATGDAPIGARGVWVNDVLAVDGLALVAADGHLWRSTDDAGSWEHVDDAAFAADGESSFDLRAVTETDDGYLISGGEPGQGMVWRSPDGRTWERTPVEGAGALYDVVAVDGTVVVTGRSEEGAAVFVSEDAGRTWERAEVGRASAGPENGMFVVAHGPAGWVATGYGGGDAQHATIWTSQDARSWDLVEGTGLSGSGVIDALAADEDGYLALRAGGAVLASADGRQWEEVSRLEAPSGDREREAMLRFGGLTRLDEGWLAVGGSSDVTGAPQAYTSADGADWQAEAIAETGNAGGLGVLPDGTAVAAGRTGACEGPEPCGEDARLTVWRGTP